MRFTSVFVRENTSATLAKEYRSTITKTTDRIRQIILSSFVTNCDFL